MCSRVFEFNGSQRIPKKIATILQFYVSSFRNGLRVSTSKFKAAKYSAYSKCFFYLKKLKYESLCRQKKYKKQPQTHNQREQDTNG